MFCTNCGTQLPDGTEFCTNCGVKLTAEQPVNNPQTSEEFGGPAPAAPEVPAAPVYTAAPAQNFSEPPYPQPAPAEVNSTPVLVWGIIGLAFSCSWIGSLLGIIFSAVAGSKVKAYLAAGGVLAGKAKVGRILGKIGLILGIVMFVILIIYVAAFGALLGSLARYY